MSNLNSWDQKYSTLLQKLDDLQEEKDHPKKQVVDVELDELCVLPFTHVPPFFLSALLLTLF